MPLEPKNSRIISFFVIGCGLALLMAGLKALFAWITHTYAYSIPWIGGFLKSFEMVEISNLVVFAILGVGIGAATILLPADWPNKLKLAFLLVLTPFVFSASYMMQQHLWIQQVAARGNISYREARDVTNRYLQRETGQGGFFGFYPFSTQLSDLPTRLEVLRSERSVNPSKLLSQELSSYDDPRADFAAYVFDRVGWLIRFMYMTIAVLTAVIYYFKGALWADGKKAAAGIPATGMAQTGRTPLLGKPSSAASAKPGAKSSKAKSSKAKSPKAKSSKGKSSKTPSSKTPSSKTPSSKIQSPQSKPPTAGTKPPGAQSVSGPVQNGRQNSSVQYPSSIHNSSADNLPSDHAGDS